VAPFDTVPTHEGSKVRVIVACMDVAEGCVVAVPTMEHAGDPPNAVKVPAGNVNVSDACVPDNVAVIVPLTTLGLSPGGGAIVRTAGPVTLVPFCVAVQDNLSGSKFGSSSVPDHVPVRFNVVVVVVVVVGSSAAPVLELEQAAIAITQPRTAVRRHP